MIDSSAYYDQLMMILAVFERAALILMALFLLSQTHMFKHIVRSTQRTATEKILLSLLFIFFTIFSTYTGIHVAGSIVNVRIIAIISGGILFGPWVAIPAGLIAGVHRYLIDIGGPSSIPCLITTILAGFMATWIHLKSDKQHYARYGILAGIFCEALTMLLIYVLASDKTLAIEIVKNIALPMIIGTLSIGLMIKLVQDLNAEYDLVAAQESKRALDIANQTLPYFRDNHRDSLSKVCDIICTETQADAVSITDTTAVLAYVGVGEEHFADLNHEISQLTHQAVTSGQSILSNNLQEHNFQSVLILPLTEQDKVTGTLKLFYRKSNQIRPSLTEMATGLSHLISTQLEISRIQTLKSMASKAEFVALQNKINPHFLFNALNAISTLIRIRPDEARQLIANLADYLRFNLEVNNEFIDVSKELQQVKDYVAIEQARFGSKLTVVFDIDEVAFSIPCLLIQPLVENAIQHGIQPFNQAGIVTITIKDAKDKYQIKVTDTGKGIAEEVINKLYNESISSKHIGLMNVHQRIKLLYGKGLKIKRLEPGTEISFTVKKDNNHGPK